MRIPICLGGSGMERVELLEGEGMKGMFMI
jgi:hypothetical protein